MRVCQALSLICCVVAWVLIVLGFGRSVLVTGPILFTTGALMTVGGVVTRKIGTIGFGISHVAICLLFVSLVNLLGWSPRSAERPFTIMGAAYIVAVTAVAASSHVLRRSSQGPSGPQRP